MISFYSTAFSIMTMVEHKIEDKLPKITLTQKCLLFSLYSLIALMVVFSLLALRNLGKEGYDHCIQKKCENHGEAFCNKFREINNCCEGAGGKIAAAGSQYQCVFQ